MIKPITKQEIESIKSKKDSVKLIDIRTPAEYEKAHIEGAINIPAEILADSTSIFTEKDVIVFICNKGHERSQHAASIISSKGFSNVYYLEGGVVGWLAE